MSNEVKPQPSNSRAHVVRLKSGGHIHFEAHYDPAALDDRDSIIIRKIVDLLHEHEAYVTDSQKRKEPV